MNTVQQWKNGSIQDIPHFRRLVVTPEPNCNLACDHCYFAHNKVNPGPDIIDWSECIDTALSENILVFCAGRIITPRVIRFCEEYLRTANTQSKPTHLSLVDNGYTVFNLEHLFDQIETFNISIDGADAQKTWVTIRYFQVAYPPSQWPTGTSSKRKSWMQTSDSQ